MSLLLAVGSLIGYSRSPNDKSINALLMTVTGFFIGGPSNMISSAISADLGRQELIQRSSEALATVTGIVDGSGSIGAAVGQYLVSLIRDKLGWMWVFYFFILMETGSHIEGVTGARETERTMSATSGPLGLRVCPNLGLSRSSSLILDCQASLNTASHLRC
ncbi:solute carrier family 37 member 3 [Homo sapiens]|nr:solute carrier family 37 member 3 [Homo sapiens]KAI4016043.1 solute carrier family 37 member 3 [Homo sapiens]